MELFVSKVPRLESLGSDVLILEETGLSNEKKEQAVETIRRIKPQSRGSVVASGGKFLPISGSKKLNLQNTPVMIVKEKNGGSDSVPIYVFPCKIGERYYDVREGISFLLQSLPDLPELQGEMEETLIVTLKSHPERLEAGLSFRSSEDTLRTGKADLIFTDAISRILLVEVERVATDAAVGQILRLAAGYEKDHGSERIRCGIVCYRVNSNVILAMDRAGIEVWKAEGQGEKFTKL
jgi:hypothetical protein